MKKELSKINFLAAPGIILLDPILKTKKSDMMVVNDTVDDPHRGYVVAVGEPKPFESYPTELQKTDVKLGDLILYSIVGCEKVRLEYEGDMRHEFVIVPFNRVLGKIK